jgi:hypothetical protein
MPQLIAAALTAIGVAATTAMVVSNIIFLVGSMALSSWQQRKAKRKANDQYNAAQVDRFANVASSIMQRDLVLGRVRKGGGVHFRASTGAHREYFIMHQALAGHEIDAVEQVYLNDVPVTLDVDGNVLDEPYRQQRKTSHNAYIGAGGTSVELDDDPVPDSIVCMIDGLYANNGYPPEPTTYTLVGRTVTVPGPFDKNVTVTYQVNRISYHARIWWNLGAADQLSDSRTRELFPELWTEAHRARGVAYLVVEFRYNETAFPNGMPAVTTQLRGAKVYDPRSGLTVWSQNPALLARHVYQHSQFGKATVSAAEDVRFTAAANACDVGHPYQLPTHVDSRAIYQASIVVPYGSPARELLDDLTQSMAGMWAFAGGELFIRAGVYTAPVMTLTEADLAVVQREGDSETQESIAISVHRERAQKFNVVNARIWDENQTYKQVALSPVRAAALITADGEELAQEVSLPAVTFAPQAQHVAGVMMRDARDPLTIDAPFKLKAYPLELFDTVNLTLARYGWAAKTFIVLSRVWDRSRGTVKLTLKETSAAIYTPDAAFLAQGYAVNTELPRPFNIQPPALSADSIYSGTSELRSVAGSFIATVRVTWPAVLDHSILQGGKIELQWAPSGAASWQSVIVDGDETEAVLVGLQEAQAIVLRARTRNSVAVSDWCLQVVHIVVGKSEPPSDVVDFTIDVNSLAWSAVADSDLAGYRLRFNYGQNTAWGTASPLHSGLVTASPWTPEVLPPGQTTLLIKAVDTSGNESANPAAIITNLGDTIIANLVFTYDDKAAGFPGTKTDCTVSGGNLVATDSGGLFWGSAGSAFWKTDSSVFWPTATYLALGYIASYSVPSLYAGTRLTLSATVAAESYVIEYRYDTTGLFWEDVANYFWPADDAALFWAQPAAWQTWPGEIASVPEGVIEFRISAAAGFTQGVVSALALVFDVADQTEELDNVVISAVGTRLPITKTYRSINNIQLTLQSDGGAARYALYQDKLATGPLVACFDLAGAQVAGNLDARIQGVKG